MHGSEDWGGTAGTPIAPHSLLVMTDGPEERRIGQSRGHEKGPDSLLAPLSAERRTARGEAHCAQTAKPQSRSPAPSCLRCSGRVKGCRHQVRRASRAPRRPTNFRTKFCPHIPEGTNFRTKFCPHIPEGTYQRGRETNSLSHIPEGDKHIFKS